MSLPGIFSTKPHGLTVVIDIPHMEKAIHLPSVFRSDSEIRAELSRQIESLYPSIHRDLVWAYTSPSQAEDVHRVYLVREGDFREALARMRPPQGVVERVELKNLPGVYFRSLEMLAEYRKWERTQLVTRIIHFSTLAAFLTAMALVGLGVATLGEKRLLGEVLNREKEGFKKAQGTFTLEKEAMADYRLRQAAWESRLWVTPVLGVLAACSRKEVYLTRVEEDGNGFHIEGVSVDEKSAMTYVKDLAGRLEKYGITVGLTSSEKDGEDRVAFKFALKQ